MKQRIVIFSGGSLGDWALQKIEDGDVLVGADKGALFLISHGYQPAMALGDFDSVTPVELEEIRLNSQSFLGCDPVMKDLTDTEMAFEWAMEQQPEEIVLIGATGTRLDHTLANIHLLSKGLQAGILCKIIDANNEVTLIDHYIRLNKSRYTHVSLLPLSREVIGITLDGFQYPLSQATLRIGQSLGISNVMTEDSGQIWVQTGQLLVIQSRD